MSVGLDMRIFLDVGAHDGETLDIALDPRWGFDRIHSFEPASTRLKTLRKFRHRKLAIHDFGLSSQTKNTTLYGAGLLGGSIYSEKNYLDAQATSFTEEIKLESATEWLSKNTKLDDDIYLKLNCEGSEADILEDLISHDSISKIKSIYVDFDIRKVPGQAYRQKEIEDKLKFLGVDFQTPELLGIAANAGVEKWLAGCLVKLEPSFFKKLYFSSRLYRPLYLTAKNLSLKFLPLKIQKFLISKFGRHKIIRF
jgi:FkbM family methyltransferase